MLTCFRAVFAGRMIENPDAFEKLKKKNHTENMRNMAETMKTQCLRALYGEV